MATYYVRSTTGNDANDGLTWATAKATLVGALAVAVAGDRIWVSQVHAETQATAMTLTSAGTADAPIEILCGNDAAEPPTALATTATISTTGASALLTSGFAYIYGITFSVGGGGANNANLNLLGTTAVTGGFVLEACGLVAATTSTATAARIVFGAQSTNSADQRVTLINCTTTFGHANQRLGFYCNTDIRGGIMASGGTVPTTLILGALGFEGVARFQGVDLTAFDSGKSLVSVAAGQIRVQIEQCKLAASVALTTGTNPGPGGPRAFLDNCDSADTQVRMQRHSYEGDVYSETTIVRTGGASNGTTPLSHRMVSSASRVFVDPLYGPDLVIWNNLTGIDKTVTVEIVHDSATNLTDAEVWLEVEYLGTSGFPLSLFAMDRAATIIATPVNQAASSVAWTTTGIAVVNKQKLEVTFTPQEIGIIRARVALAKSAYTIYVDPLLTVA